MGLLRRNKSKKKNSDSISTSTPKKSGSGEVSRSLSVKSTPGQQYNTLSSPLNPMRASYDVGNRTEPVLSHSRTSSPSRRQGGWRQKTYLTPEINPVRPRQSKGIFSIKRDSNNSSSDDEHHENFFLTNVLSSTGHTDSNDEFSPGIPSISLPFAKSNNAAGSQYSFQSSQNTHNTPSRRASIPQAVESVTDQEQEDKPNKDTTNHTGLFSTFMSAAHTAATHIGSITGTKSHTEGDEANTTNNGNFIQHLDSLLSLNGSKKHVVPSPAVDTVKQQEEDLDTISQTTSKSIAHDVKFEPLRKTIISTLGKGELTLEDLGFSAVHTNANNVEPQIQVHPPTHPPPVVNSPDLSPQSESPPAIPNSPMSDHNPKPPPLKTTLSSSTQVSESNSQRPSVQLLRQGHSSRSLSPPQKRSRSPIVTRTQDPKRLSIPRRSLSTNGHNGLLNGDITFGTPLSQASSIDLKNVTFANGKRDAEFHSIFKKLPKTERLIDDFSCALQRELMVQGRMLMNEKILVQGRMYISEKFISFKSNILGWVTSLSIPIQEIVQLEKRNTAGVFPNAISIQTLHQKYVFASFLQRDVTFDLITNIWNQIVRGSMGGHDDSISQEDTARGRSRTMSFGSRGKPSDSEEYSEDDEYDSDESFSDLDDDNDDTKSINGQGGEDDAPNIFKHAPTEPQHSENPGEVKITEQLIQAPLPKVFSLLFGKDTSFFKQVITKQKNINISEISAFQPKDGVPTREYHYTKPLGGPVGPKETTCNVVETLDHKDFQGYVRCVQNTRTPDVPSGNSFSTVTYIYLSWGPKNSTKLTVYTYMNWTGKSWIRAAIDRGSIDGQKESISILVDELKSKAASDAPSTSSSAASESGATSSLPLVGPKTHPSANFKPNVPSPESIITEETLQAPLGTVYSLFMNPDYLKQILVAQKMYEISDIPPFPEDGQKKRSYNYIKPLNGSIGPKSTKCNVTDTIEHYDLDSYIQVTRVVSTPDVPSGSSFYVSTNFWLSWSENNSTKVVISTGVVWKSRSWLKAPIERGSIDGQKEGNVLMINEVKSIIARDASGGKSRKRGKTLVKPKTSPVDEEQEFLNRLHAPTKAYNITIPGLSSLINSPLNSLFALFVFAVVVWVSIRLINGAIGSGTPLSLEGGINKVMIGGREYLIIPSVDKLVEDPTEKLEKEYEIWKWIESRTDKSESPREFTASEKGKDNIAAVMKAHKEQDLREMLHIAESNLAELLHQLDDKNTDSSTIL